MSASSSLHAAPAEASRITFTVKGCIGRCTFLAGFAYYELAGNDFKAFYDPAFVVLMTATFALSVVAVGLGTLILYYLERSRTAEQQRAFVAQCNNLYVRGCFRLFLLALLLYVIGLGRSGFVNFANNSAATYAVMAASLLLVPAIFWGLVVIVRAQLQLQHNDGVSTERELLDANAVVATSSFAAPAGGGGGALGDASRQRHQADDNGDGSSLEALRACTRP
jgi:hypothetical protein